MGDSLKAISEAEDEYDYLCKRYGEDKDPNTGASGTYSDHHYKLRAWASEDHARDQRRKVADNQRHQARVEETTRKRLLQESTNEIDAHDKD